MKQRNLTSAKVQILIFTDKRRRSNGGMTEKQQIQLNCKIKIIEKTGKHNNKV